MLQSKKKKVFFNLYSQCIAVLCCLMWNVVKVHNDSDKTTSRFKESPNVVWGEGKQKMRSVCGDKIKAVQGSRLLEHQLWLLIEMIDYCGSTQKRLKHEKLWSTLSVSFTNAVWGHDRSQMLWFNMQTIHLQQSVKVNPCDKCWPNRSVCKCQIILQLKFSCLLCTHVMQNTKGFYHDHILIHTPAFYCW